MNSLPAVMKPFAAAIAALLVLGGVGIVWAQSSQDDETYQITAYFTKAIGLFENSDVDILGVPVGTVTEIAPEGTRVRVEMEIDSEYRIEKSADTFAQIVPISVISDRYVQLGPVWESGEYLRHGDVLDTDITQIPAELDDVFKQLKKLLDAIEPGKKGEPGALGDLIVQLNRTLEDREQDLRGTLISGAQLTDALADAENDISGMLVNLDSLFGRLATRANEMGELNRNFAIVMTALAESRSDLEGTLTNLADLTEEVGDFAQDNGDRLGRDLRLASRVTSVIVKNRNSVEESLSWLPTVGKGVSQAYHHPPYSDIDVRDNANARLECALLDPLPPGPVKDALRDLCEEETGEPRAAAGPAPLPVPDTPGEAKLNCDEGVRKVRRQLKKISKLGLPEAALDEILEPMRKRLKELKKECRELGEIVEDPSDLLDELPDFPPLPDPLEESEVDASNVSARELSGQAAGPRIAPTETRGPWDSFRRFMGGFMAFLGVGS